MPVEKQKSEVKPSIDEELQAFVPIPKSIKTLSGEQVEVPKTAWKDEIQIGRLLGKAVTEIPDLQKVDWRNIKIQDMISLLPTVINVAPEVITGITSSLLKKDNEWVEENLNSESILELLGPFFKGSLNRILKNVKLPEVLSKIRLPK